MRFIPIAGFILLVTLLGFLLITKPGPEANFDVGVTDKPLPALSLSALEGKGTWDKKQLLGHVTVLNFFASWCSPCEAEMPELGALKKQFPNVKFAGIAWNDEPQTIKKWLAKNGNPFDTLWLDKEGDASMALGLKAIPETIIVDANGTMRYRLSGPVTKQLRASKIDPLLAQLAEEAAHAN